MNARFWKKKSKFRLPQQWFAFDGFCMETRLSSIFKTTNIIKLTDTILKSYYRVFQVTSIWKTLKRLVYFFMSHRRLGYFWHWNCHKIVYILGTAAKLYFSESPYKSLKPRQSSHQQDHPLRPLRNNGPLYKMKNLCFWRILFQNEKCWHFEFLMNQIFGQSLPYLRN